MENLKSTTLTGKPYIKSKKTQLTFYRKRHTQFEHCHNLIAQIKPEENKEYNSKDAILMARLIKDLNLRNTKE